MAPVFAIIKNRYRNGEGVSSLRSRMLTVSETHKFAFENAFYILKTKLKKIYFVEIFPPINNAVVVRKIDILIRYNLRIKITSL